VVGYVTSGMNLYEGFSIVITPTIKFKMKLELKKEEWEIKSGKQ
jgi:hypothetical protein